MDVGLKYERRVSQIELLGYSDAFLAKDADTGHSNTGNLFFLQMVQYLGSARDKQYYLCTPHVFLVC